MREIRGVGCPFYPNQGLHEISAAMPNLASISPFHHYGPSMLELLVPTSPSPPPSPHLELVMILRSEQGWGTGGTWVYRRVQLRPSRRLQCVKLSRQQSMCWVSHRDFGAGRVTNEIHSISNSAIFMRKAGRLNIVGSKYLHTAGGCRTTKDDRYQNTFTYLLS